MTEIGGWLELHFTYSTQYVERSKGFLNKEDFCKRFLKIIKFFRFPQFYKINLRNLSHFQENYINKFLKSQGICQILLLSIVIKISRPIWRFRLQKLDSMGNVGYIYSLLQKLQLYTYTRVPNVQICKFNCCLYMYIYMSSWHLIVS